MGSLDMVPSRLKRVAGSVCSVAHLGYRQASRRYRALPDFLIIGAQKCGTSSLFSYLSQHPQLIPSYLKEIFFFDGGVDPKVDYFAKGQDWYRSHFPLRKRVAANQQTFEATPSYIFNPLVPKRIAALIPNVKLIVLLRNPTERAISHYFHNRRKEGREPLSILDAMQAEEERLKHFIENKDYRNEILVRQSYKIRGIYSEQISRYFQYFPVDNILVLCSEKFFSEPDKTLRRVFNFLAVDPSFTVDDLTPRNVAMHKTTVEPNVYEYLNDYFRAHNQVLYELVGEDYGW